MLPYNNQLYVMKIKGETLLEIIEAATCSLPSQIGAFPQVSGIRYTVNTKVPYETGSSMKIPPTLRPPSREAVSLSMKSAENRLMRIRSTPLLRQSLSAAAEMLMGN